MPDWLPPILTLLFTAHLVAFLRLAIRRGGAYYWLVVSLFMALTGSFALRWLVPDLALGVTPAHLLLRYVAWSIALITIPMLVWRMIARQRYRS